MAINIREMDVPIVSRSAIERPREQVLPNTNSTSFRSTRNVLRILNIHSIRDTPEEAYHSYMSTSKWAQTILKAITDDDEECIPSLITDIWKESGIHSPYGLSLLQSFATKLIQCADDYISECERSLPSFNDDWERKPLTVYIREPAGKVWRETIGVFERNTGGVINPPIKLYGKSVFTLQRLNPSLVEVGNTYGLVSLSTFIARFGFGNVCDELIQRFKTDEGFDGYHRIQVITKGPWKGDIAIMSAYNEDSVWRLVEDTVLCHYLKQVDMILPKVLSTYISISTLHTDIYNDI